MPKSKSLWTVALAALVVVAAAACVDDTKPAPGTSGNPVPSASSSESSSESESVSEAALLKVAAVDAAPGTFSFDTAGVEAVPAGPVDFTFTNSGADQHEARLIKVLNGNVDEYRAALSSGGPAAVASLGQQVAIGGPLQSGASATQSIDLEPGVYVLADFLTRPEGTTFAEDGMLREIAVVPE
jgi:hypothetical protein